ncbi:MAG: universal stress protein [Nitrososphaeria archaeon]|nr:universal stress protein [Nitrososphaeria archaeon]
MGEELSFQLDKILLPLSYTSYEINAVYIAFYISECSGSKVTILHVKPPDEENKTDFVNYIKKIAEEFKIKYEIVEKVLERFSHKAVSEEIVKVVKSEDFSYIIMPAHREKFYTEFFGRISDRVVRKTNNKVIIVEVPQEGIRLPLKLKKIFALSFEKEVPKELMMLATLLTSSASTKDVEVRLVGAIELPPTVPLDEIESSDEFIVWKREFYRNVGKYIKLLGRPITPAIITIREADDVINYLKENNADILLISTKRPKRGNLLRQKEYEIVKRAKSVVLVTIS